MQRWSTALLLLAACDCGGELLGTPLGPPTDGGSAPTSDAGPAPAIGLPTFETIIVDGDRPVALAIGSLFFDESISLAVLACRGDEAACRVGTQATPPFGATRLAVFNGIGQATRRLTIGAREGLGILPAGIGIGRFEEGGAPSLAIVNSRTAICQRRVCAANTACGCWRADPNVPIECPCESSEVLLFGPANSADLLLQQRLTMTGSNAVGLAFVEQAAGASFVSQLAIVEQGRSRDLRPCLRVQRCLPYLAAECGSDLCGCPPDERCECSPDACGDGRTPGVCYAADETIDLVATRSGQAFHRHSCRSLEQYCNADDPTTSFSACTGPGDENLPDRRDACSCQVPYRIHVGTPEATSKPFSIAAGPMSSAHDWGLIVASATGLQLFGARADRSSWQWEGAPNLVGAIDQAIAAQLDPRADGTSLKADAVWLARRPCAENVVTDLCRRQPGPRPDLPALGCFGTFVSAGMPLLNGRPDERCHHFDLDFVPGNMCSADFDGDDTDDVAVTDPEGERVLIFIGDDRGSLRPVPAAIAINAPGPIACGDLDGDRRPDLAVGDLDDGTIHLLRSGP